MPKMITFSAAWQQMETVGEVQKSEMYLDDTSYQLGTQDKLDALKQT